MTWKPDTRPDLVKTFGDYTLTPERNSNGETAHLIDLGDRQIRVLPDGSSSGQKRAQVVRRALEGVSVLSGAPVDLVETYLVGAVARENLSWEYVENRKLSIEDWLAKRLGGPDGDLAAARSLLSALDIAGYEIVEKS